MTTIVVLFNLQTSADRDRYEAWARERDVPTVSALPSVERFEVLRSAGLLMGDGDPPYRYIELIRVRDMQAFGDDVAASAVQEVAAEFAEFADSPVFIVTEAIA